MEKKSAGTDWKKVLTEEQFRVTREQGTERAYTGKYNQHKEKGQYCCICCGKTLFSSDHKYDSGSGWPSYWQPLSDDSVIEKKDNSHGVIRVEVRCAGCDAHLGHVFNDGPAPTGLRYCINSVALDFEEKED